MAAAGGRNESAIVADLRGRRVPGKAPLQGPGRRFQANRICSAGKAWIRGPKLVMSGRVAL